MTPAMAASAAPMIQVQRTTFSVSRPATRGKFGIVGDGAHRAAGLRAREEEMERDGEDDDDARWP